MNPIILKFHHELHQATSMEAITRLLTQALAQYAISMFTYTCFSLNPYSKEKVKFETCSENYKAWHTHYLAEDYCTIDSTHHVVVKTNLPIFWDVEQQLAQSKTQKERKMRLDSLKFGVAKGISIPIHGAQGDYANFMVAARKEESCLEQWQKIQYELLLIAHYYHHYSQHFILKAIIPSKEFCLSHREMQCLTLTAKKYTVELIAQALNISVRTVNFHLQNINKKLGARNKHQSVTLAIENGIIEL